MRAGVTSVWFRGTVCALPSALDTAARTASDDGSDRVGAKSGGFLTRGEDGRDDDR